VSSSDPPLMVGGECTRAEYVPSGITAFAHHRAGPFEDGEIKQAKGAEWYHVVAR